MPTGFFGFGGSNHSASELPQSEVSPITTLPQPPENVPIMGNFPVIEVQPTSSEIQEGGFDTAPSSSNFEGSTSTSSSLSGQVKALQNSGSLSMSAMQLHQLVQNAAIQAAHSAATQVIIHQQHQNGGVALNPLFSQGSHPGPVWQTPSQTQMQVQAQAQALALASQGYYSQLLQQVNPYTLGQLSQQNQSMTPPVPVSSTNLYLGGPTTHVQQETGSVPIQTQPNSVSSENVSARELALQQKLNWLLKMGVGVTTFLLGAFLGKTFSNGQVKTESKLKVGETTVLRVQQIKQGHRHRF